ncbi:hypothetical protein QR685DRAFT_544094 [Neurospora intermedia]|uniref:Uncharacterized protein n=1 Tax=Neurospora intermedia TaxID=5142 RepID=A0ABR3DDM5_NEUIN
MFEVRRESYIYTINLLNKHRYKIRYRKGTNSNEGEIKGSERFRAESKVADYSVADDGEMAVGPPPVLPLGALQRLLRGLIGSLSSSLSILRRLLQLYGMGVLMAASALATYILTAPTIIITMITITTRTLTTVITIIITTTGITIAAVATSIVTTTATSIVIATSNIIATSITVAILITFFGRRIKAGTASGIYKLAIRYRRYPLIKGPK